MKILAWDIETLPMAVFLWHLGKHSHISHDNIIQESSIVCAAWKYVEIDKRVRSVSVMDCKTRFDKNAYDDYHVVKKLHSVLQDADVLLAQNGDNFDLKIFNWRAKRWGLDPAVPKVQTIDTLKESRKVFRPPSHRLDYKNKALGHEGKERIDIREWFDIALYGIGKGDKITAISALKKMIHYNKRDVEALEEMYLDERAWYKQHPNRLLYDPNVDGCPTCGGKSYSKNGYRHTVTGIYQAYHCSSCGKRFQGTKRLHKVELKN